MSARALAQSEGQFYESNLQTRMVSSAQLFRAEIEREIQTALQQTSGLSAADQIAARTTIIAAVKAALW